MNRQQREEFIEAVMLNVNISGRAAAQIVDRVIAPALAIAWDEGHRAGTVVIATGRRSANPYDLAPSPQQIT